MRIVILGLSITSSWGNGHATTYRSLVRALERRGHDILFLERDVPWYAENRDLPRPPYGETYLYDGLDQLREKHARAVGDADLVIVGSYVPDGIRVGRWVQQTAKGTTAFYDIDTPVTLASLARGDCEYISPALIPGYNFYLSFTGGPTLRLLERQYGAQEAKPLYCSVDPEAYFAEPAEERWDLGYMGTYSDDRQPPLEKLMLEAARSWTDGRFIVAGPQYPEHVQWPENVERRQHLPPAEHRDFYNAQRYTLNITRADMKRAGYAPSVRLFEAAACGTPIISDYWEGLETILKPGEEILISDRAATTAYYLRELSNLQRERIAERARQRVLSAHTADHRAAELEAYVQRVPVPA